MDYVSYFFQMEAYCGAVERLIGLEIPPRAKYLRTIMLELNQDPQPPRWLGTTALDHRRDLDALVLLPRARPDPRPLRNGDGQRMHTRYFQSAA